MKNKLITLLIIAALVLTGAVPSFAAGENNKNSNSKEPVSSVIVDQSDAPSVAGTSVVMIDGGSGEILYEKNAYEKRDPASITKIMTCLVVLETMDLDEKVTVTADSSKMGHNMDLKKGEVLTVRQLLYAMMLDSANDAAEVLALASGGTMSNFCDMMNQRAVRCGAKDTHFTNPNGLNTYGQDNHRTTAYDISLISKEAMKNPQFRKLVSTKKYTIPATNKSDKRVVKSTNPCLYSKKTVEIDGVQVPFKYEGCTGIKTGTTSVAGFCFAGSAKKKGTELIVVTLNSEEEERFADAIKLWDYGFSKYYTYKVAGSKEPLEEVKVRRGAESTVPVGIQDDMKITLNKDYDKEDIRVEITLKDSKVTAPVKKGTVMGSITAYNKKDEPVAFSDLYALKTVEKGGPLSYIGIADEDIPLFIVSVVLALIILIAIRIVYVKIRRKKRERRRAQRQRNVRRREWEKERNPFDDSF